MDTTEEKQKQVRAIFQHTLNGEDPEFDEWMIKRLEGALKHIRDNPIKITPAEFQAERKKLVGEQ